MLKGLSNAFLAGAISVLVGIGSAAAQEPVKGGTLTYVFNPEPPALSTIITTSVPVVIVSTKIYESLLNWEGPDLKPLPGLAESWTVSDDGKIYTFHLRSGVKWHDGEPFSAADVKFSIEQIVRPYHPRGKVYFGDVESIDTPDPLTVIFRLKLPVPYFLKAFQPGEAPIMPKHKFDGVDMSSAAAVRQADIMTKPVGTGPFRFKEWSRGSYIILERNPDYWRPGHPYLDQIVLRVIPDGAARAIAVENGEVDLAPMSSLPEAEIQRLSKLPNLEISTKGTEALGPVMWLEINTRSGPLADVRVRQAMSLALDRSKIADVIWYGYGKPATGPIVSANEMFYDNTLKPYEYNPKKAASLLDEAGYKRGADNIRFHITQNFLPYGENWVRLAEYVKQELGRLGIAVETKSTDLGGWLKTVYTDWDYNIASNFTHNYSDPSIGVSPTFTSYNIRRGAPFTNSMGYKNTRVDELFQAAAREMDVGKRKMEFAEVQQILHTEQPVLFLMEMQYVHVFNKHVHGIITNGISMYSNWDSVWKDK
jgi:peptide/nickel transport system substrate-binding protein